MSEQKQMINAVEYQTDDGSVVHSGVSCADAVLEALEQGTRVVVNFAGVKGASSSYFNVFLRRINEECGLGILKDVLELEYGNKVQEAMFERSFRSMLRPESAAGLEVHKETLPASTSEHEQSFMHTIFMAVFSLFRFR